MRRAVAQKAVRKGRETGRDKMFRLFWRMKSILPVIGKTSGWTWPHAPVPVHAFQDKAVATALPDSVSPFRVNFRLGVPGIERLSAGGSGWDNEPRFESPFEGADPAGSPD